MKVWDRLDEVIGAALISAIAITAMVLNYDHSVAQMSVTGVVAILASKMSSAKLKGQE